MDGEGHGGLSIVWIGKRDCVKIDLIPIDQGRILSVKSGNPITIHDEDIGALLPGTMVCFFAGS